jgi:hypothetical protein
MDGADAMLSGETATGTILYKWLRRWHRLLKLSKTLR